MNIFLTGHREQYCPALEKRLRPGLNDVPSENAGALLRGCEHQKESEKIFRLPTNGELKAAGAKPPTEKELVAAGFDEKKAKTVAAGFERKEAPKPAPPKASSSNARASSSKPPPKEK